jgi:hypothetical protein
MIGIGTAPKSRALPPCDHAIAPQRPDDRATCSGRLLEEARGNAGDCDAGMALSIS